MAGLAQFLQIGQCPGCLQLHSTLSEHHPGSPGASLTHWSPPASVRAWYKQQSQGICVHLYLGHWLKCSAGKLVTPSHRAQEKGSHHPAGVGSPRHPPPCSTPAPPGTLRAPPQGCLRLPATLAACTMADAPWKGSVSWGRGTNTLVSAHRGFRLSHRSSLSAADRLVLSDGESARSGDTVKYKAFAQSSQKLQKPNYSSISHGC